jgi:hypothetical protein
MDPRDDDKPEQPPAEEREESGLRDKLEALVPELVKRTFAAGMGAVFNTEEGIRKLARDISLPKDVANYLANTAGNTKDEVVRIVAREVREFLERMNLAEEVAKLLTTLSFEIKTEIRFIPNSEKYSGVEPDVQTKMRLKRAEERGDKDKDKDREKEKDRDKDGKDDAPASDKPDSPDEREGRRWRRILRRGTERSDDDETPADDGERDRDRDRDPEE